ncbi:IGR protein motif-domain-containing protein [Entophlyctis helioformis]|nr:IGR protein motif-domain-containing protein [Entophlyctis helioformis]
MAAGVRSKSTYAIPNKEVAAKYMELSAGDRRAHVPLPSGAVQDPASFFKAIGRNTPTATDKFKDWNHLFVATSREMKKLGIKSQMRKYILGWREWYKRGNELKAIELPKRQKKHLKLQEEVRRARLERLGMI